MSTVEEVEEDKPEEVIVGEDSQEDNSNAGEEIVEDIEIDKDTLQDDDIEDLLELPKGLLDLLPESDEVDMLVNKVRDYIDNKRVDIEDYQNTLKEYEETLEEREYTNGESSWN